MGRRATNNPRKRESKACGCPDSTAKFRPGTKPTRKADACICSWQYRYDGPDGRERALNRPTYDEAKEAGEATKVAIRERRWIDPDRGDITIDQLWAIWWPLQKKKGLNARLGDESMWRTHAQSHWGHWKVWAIGHAEVQAWANDLAGPEDDDGDCQGPLMPSSVRRVFALLDGMLAFAVVDKRLTFNPCDGVRLPTVRKPHPEDRKPPTVLQLRRVRRALPAYYRTLQLVAQETGLRWGELIGLRACWVDLDAARIHVREVIVSERGHQRRKRYPKSDAGFRTVPLTPRAVGALRRHMEQVRPATTRTEPKSGMHGEELLFRGRRGGYGARRGEVIPLGEETFKRVWHRAIQDAGVARVTVRQLPDGKTRRKLWPNFHSQRKTFASTLHALGAPEAVVQEVLGHERAGEVTWLYTFAARDVAGQVYAALTDKKARQGPFLRVVGESGISPETPTHRSAFTRSRAM
ncbi:integrase [Streptacidiphilus sp. MAP12-33]|uniref:tyrosine-type recombinase/integrase n=1 Tax=Streptacidiphilus sp. MAP12-33 TaxID=3156266 RepID=UPI0035113B2E